VAAGVTECRTGSGGCGAGAVDARSGGWPDGLRDADCGLGDGRWIIRSAGEPYGSEGWGFESLRAGKIGRPLACRFA